MNSIEYLESKGVFMQPGKRRYKIIKRNGCEVYVLKSERISKTIRRVRFYEDVACFNAKKQNPG